MRHALVNAQNQVVNIIEAENGFALATDELRVVPDAEGVSAIGMGYEDGVFKSAWDMMSFEEKKAATRRRIDEETQASIAAGFFYEADGKRCHFSYDAFDQQNFADTASAALMAMSGVAGLPESVLWNAWDESGALVRLEFSASEFLELYAAGALAHKTTRMEEAAARKAAVDAAQTPEELLAL